MDLPTLAATKPLVQRYAALVARLRAELNPAPLVLPTGEFFPDTFVGDEASVSKLVHRMQNHAGIDDIPIKVAVVDVDGGGASSSCSTGACAAPSLPSSNELARLEDLGDGWRFNVPAPEVKHPTVMTSNLARSLGLAFLVETKPEDAALEEPVIATAELAATALGYGALLMQGAYVYQKSCGGPSVQRFTALSLPELSILVALFITAGQHKSRAALKELDTTQSALLDEALAWVRSNPDIVSALQERPEKLARGDFQLRETTSWLGRLMSKKQTSSAEDIDPEASLDELESALSAFGTTKPSGATSKPRDPKKDSLRELVDEAFS